MCSFGSGGGSSPEPVKVDPTPTQVSSVASETADTVLKKDQRKRVKANALATDRGTLLGNAGMSDDMTSSNRSTLG